MAVNKYYNKKIIVDGIQFDSKAEAKYYEQLKWLKQAKQIKDFKLQPRYLLQEGFKKNGKTFRKLEYVADFEIHNLDDSVCVVDIKGAPPTKEFMIKYKLFERKFLESLTVLFFKPEYGGFIEWDRLKELEKKVKPNAKKKATSLGYPGTDRKRAKSNRL